MREKEKDNGIRYKADADALRKKNGMQAKRRFFPRRALYIAGLILLALATAAMFVVLIITDFFPSDLTIIISVSLLLVLVLICLLFSSRRRWKRVLGILLAAVFVVAIASVANFMGSTYAMFNRISASSTSAIGPEAKNVNVTEEPFNIYITGIDQWETEKGLDLERSDVNMIVTVNPVTKKVLLTSIPRDSYVKLHTAQQMDKLTHTGVYGVDETLNTVEDWLGINLNYYAKLNFSGTRDIIDAMGRIDVYSPVSFDSTKKDFHYKKGWNHLDGQQALFFARERKAFEGLDSVRVDNQQEVVKAVIRKMTSSTTLLTRYGDIMDAAGNNMSTNMPADAITELVKMQIGELCDWDIESQKIDGEYDMDYVASLSQKNMYSVYKTKESSVKRCVDSIDEVMNPSDAEIEEAMNNRSRSLVVNLVKNAENKVKNKIKNDPEQEEV